MRQDSSMKGLPRVSPYPSQIPRNKTKMTIKLETMLALLNIKLKLKI